MTSQNGIIGEQEMPSMEVQGAVPQATEDDTQLKELMKTAKFARSGEYKQLKEHFNTRIDFYTKYLPDGRPVAANGSSPQSGMEGLDLEEMGRMWVAANVIIGELKAIMNVYEQAADFAKDATTKR